MFARNQSPNMETIITLLTFAVVGGVAFAFLWANRP